MSDRIVQPLFRWLKEENKFILRESNPAELAIKLRQKELDGAFLSPIDFAKDYSMYRIIPRVAAVSRKASGTIILVFKEDTRTIRSIGADPAYGSEIVLASIILAEKFETYPQIIPTSKGPECLNQNADACLVCGNAALKLSGYNNKIDLVDEWYDLTELPYVHGFWVTRENALTKEEIDSIIKSGEDTSTHIIESTNADVQSESSLVSFSFGEIEIQGVVEFLRMAYYHGILKDIPEVRFIGKE